MARNKRKTPIVDGSEFKREVVRRSWHILKPILKTKSISIKDATEIVLDQYPTYKYDSVRTGLYDLREDPDIIIEDQKLRYVRPETGKPDKEEGYLSTTLDSLCESYKQEILNAIENDLDNIFFDFKQIERRSQRLADKLIKEPRENIHTIEQTLNDFLKTLDSREKPLFVGITNFPDEYTKSVSTLDSSDLTKLVAFDGIVTTVSDRFSRVDNALYLCNIPGCGEFNWVKQDKNILVEPYRCKACGKSDFRLLLDESELFDIQTIDVQENIQSTNKIQGRSIRVTLKGDLIDSIDLNERVRIIGEYKIKYKPKSRVFDREIIAYGIDKLQEEYDLEITKDDENEIKRIAKSEGVYKTLTDCVAPDIYGYDKIKEAVIYQAFGGRLGKKRGDRKSIKRGQVHLMLIGDPGTAKSVILQFAVNLNPKGKVISAKSASIPGLLGSAEQVDTPLGGKIWTVRAGTLALYNHGIVGIQELDKGGKELQNALHDPMEEQICSIDKAGGAKAQLIAETAIIATANPKHNRFDIYKPIVEQFDMESSLISRFDLVFPVIDDADLDRDEKIADRMLNAHAEEVTLEPELDINFIMKYISYAKNNYNPIIGKEAHKAIKDYYTSIRASVKKNQSKPTARLLDTLVRLTEASAKIRLSNTANKDDAKRAITLVNHMIKKLATNEQGELDIDNLTGKGYTDSDKLFKIKRIIKAQTKDINPNMPVSQKKIKELLAQEKINIGYNELDDLLVKLINEEKITEIRKEEYLFVTE